MNGEPTGLQPVALAIELRPGLQLYCRQSADVMQSAAALMQLTERNSEPHEEAGATVDTVTIRVSSFGSFFNLLGRVRSRTVAARFPKDLNPVEIKFS